MLIRKLMHWYIIAAAVGTILMLLLFLFGVL